MSPQQFIEAAIEGGWGKDMWYRSKLLRCDNVFNREAKLIIYQGELECEQSEYIKIEEILLDPAAWQAVGKMRGQNWPSQYAPAFYIEKDGRHVVSAKELPGWHVKMLHMIFALAEGKTLEEYLLKLVKN